MLKKLRNNESMQVNNKKNYEENSILIKDESFRSIIDKEKSIIFYNDDFKFKQDLTICVGPVLTQDLKICVESVLTINSSIVHDNSTKKSKFNLLNQLYFMFQLMKEVLIYLI